MLEIEFVNRGESRGKTPETTAERSNQAMSEKALAKSEQIDADYRVPAGLEHGY